jgi:hypothetical protein
LRVYKSAGRLVMDLALKGKTALVTGGSKGIGLAIGATLAREGCNLVLVSRSISRETVLASIGKQFESQLTTFCADLSVRGSAESLGREFPHVNILINNAGAIPTGSLFDVDEATWRAAWDLKVFGYINMCRVFYPLMQASGGGTIINIAGIGATLKSPAAVCISAGNAAIVVMSQALGSASHRDNVRVVTVNPGPVATERLANLPDAERYQRTANLPFRRAALPLEIADAVAFLASDRSAYTSGSVVTIDGGLSAGAQPL